MPRQFRKLGIDWILYPPDSWIARSPSETADRSTAGAATAIGAMLARLTDEAAHASLTPAAIVAEARLDREDPADPVRMAELGAQTAIACPDCKGPTWRLHEPGPPRYRCYLGHVASARRVLDASRDQVETALWSAIRALHERAMAFDDFAADALRAGHRDVHAMYRQKSELARAQAETARTFMVELANLRD